MSSTTLKSKLFGIQSSYMNKKCSIQDAMKEILKIALTLSETDYGYITQVNSETNDENSIDFLSIQCNKNSLDETLVNKFHEFIDAHKITQHILSKNRLVELSMLFNPLLHQDTCILKNVTSENSTLSIKDCYVAPISLALLEDDVAIVIGTLVLATQDGKRLSRRKTIKNKDIDLIATVIRGLLNVEIQKRVIPCDNLLISFVNSIPYPLIIFDNSINDILECRCKYISEKFNTLGLIQSDKSSSYIGKSIFDFKFLSIRSIRTSLQRTLISGESEEIYKIKVTEQDFLNPGCYNIHIFLTEVGLCVCISETELNDYMTSKHKFIANISHDMVTPLNGIVGMCELMQDTPLNNTQKEYIDTLRRCSITLVELIHDILDYSKLDMDKIVLEEEKFVVYELVESTIRMMHHMAKDKNIQLSIKIDQNVPTHVIGDPHRLQQILLNLLSNAVKFTDHGAVNVLVYSSELSAENLEKVQLKFVIEDTGIGIEKRHIPKLFQTFQQLSEGRNSFRGTGLGLAICKKLVSLMDGDIFVESVYGEGSTFTFTVELGVSDNIIDILDSYTHEIFEKTTILVLHRNSNARMDIFRNLLDWKFSPFLCSTLEEAEIYLKTRSVNLIVCEEELKDNCSTTTLSDCKILFIGPEKIGRAHV